MEGDASNMLDQLSVTRLTSIHDVMRLEGEWRELEAKLPPLPFVTFDWFKTWWEVLRAESLGVSDDPFVLVFRDAQRDLRAIAPFMLTRRPGRGPLSMRQLQLFGADPNITEIRTLIAPEDTICTLFPAVLAEVHACRSEWHSLQLAGIPASCSDLVGGDEQSGVEWTRDVPSYRLQLEPTWDAFKARLSRNMKEALRKCRNAPKRDGLRLDFEIVSAPDEVEPAVGTFLRLHEARSERNDRVLHPNVFSGASSQRFLHTVCRRFAERGRLRIFQLKADAAVISTRLGFVCGETLYLYYSGYDPAYARYSVMTTTVAEAIRWAIQSGLRSVNLSTGRDLSKLRWGPEETLYREIRMSSPSLWGMVTEKARAHGERTRKKQGLTALFARRV